MTGVLIGTGEDTQTQTPGKMPCDHEGRDWSDKPQAKRHQGFPGSTPGNMRHW